MRYFSWPAIAGDGCYRIDDGLLKVTMVSRTGTERILAFLGPGAIVGELSIIDGLPRSASVVAVRDGESDFLSRAAFEAFAQNHPEVYKSLVTLLAMRLRETDTVIAAGSFLPLKGRVARRCSNWPKISARTSVPAASSSAKRSGRAISLPWPVSRARMSAASSTNGSAASW